jgi:cell division septum initiation protein DivIVA
MNEIDTTVLDEVTQLLDEAREFAREAAREVRALEERVAALRAENARKNSELAELQITNAGLRMFDNIVERQRATTAAATLRRAADYIEAAEALARELTEDAGRES